MQAFSGGATRRTEPVDLGGVVREAVEAARAAVEAARAAVESSLVREIVDADDGEVPVESERGEGSTFAADARARVSM